MKGSVVKTGARAMVAVLSAPSLYLGVLTAAASLGRPRRADRQQGGSTRFVVCVPAHDEAAVIGDAVRALMQQHYPSALFDVHVVADNCTDDTAQIAAGAGASVHERTDPENRGKGAALNWLYDRLSDVEFDVLVVIDADTVADPEMLAAFHRAFSEGAAVGQGYYGVKDPASSTAVALRYAALACRHHLRPLGRNRLGASCGLYGNGMAFRADVIADRRWSNHLVEDAELQLELLLDGHIVTYVPDAVLWAEMPATTEASASQNERWELGRLQLLRSHLPTLVRRTVTGGPAPRRAYADATLDLLTPPMTLLALLDVAMVGAGGAAALARPGRRRNVLLSSGLGACAVLVVHVFTALKLAGAPVEVYRSIRSTPRFLPWKLLLLARIVRRPDAVSWTRTRRNSATAAA
jgi:1,2-diacylglycerol 3-beta-glucosyltransferase